jgi:predicted DNA-binding protein
MPRRHRERRVIIACRGPKSLKDQLVTLAERARRTQSDYMRLLLEEAIKRELKRGAAA